MLASSSTVIRLARAAVEVVSGGVALPLLTPALSIIANIIRTCEIAQANRRKLVPLKDQCKEIQELLRLFTDPASSGEEYTHMPPVLLRTLGEYQKLWEKTLQSVETWSKPVPSRVRLGWSQGEDRITEGIQKAKDDMARCFNILLITCGLQVRDGQALLGRRINERFRSLDQKMDILISNAKDQSRFKDALPSLAAECAPPLLDRMRNVLHGPNGQSNQLLKDNIINVQQNFGQILPGGELTNYEVTRDFPSGSSQISSSIPVVGTVHSDIYKGSYLGRPCALKIYRNLQNPELVRQRMQKEVDVWSRVYEKDKGDYILPFWGYVMIEKRPYIASPWMENGNVRSFLNARPEANRMSIILRVAEALAFLHNQSPLIIHGHLKGSNVLINDKHQAILADFGLAKALEDTDQAFVTFTMGVQDEYRWYAPERFDLKRISSASDVYSFAMTALEILTGQNPFYPEKFDIRSALRIVDGHRPARPLDPTVIENGLDNNVWKLLENCWCSEPASRLKMDDILGLLKECM